MSGDGPFYGRDHPMKPSAVQGTVDIPFYTGKFYWRWPEGGNERDKEEEKNARALSATKLGIDEGGNNT